MCVQIRSARSRNLVLVELSSSNSATLSTRLSTSKGVAGDVHSSRGPSATFSLPIQPQPHAWYVQVGPWIVLRRPAGDPPRGWQALEQIPDPVDVYVDVDAPVATRALDDDRGESTE